ncbi:hypothetical protein A2U01_0105614, partial [Trifolium medium]|nr:hypothetical protein [Trifolium medium]
VAAAAGDVATTASNASPVSSTTGAGRKATQRDDAGFAAAEGWATTTGSTTA